MIPEFFQISDSALLVRCGTEIDVELSRRVSSLASSLSAPGLVDLVPSYTTLLVTYDPDRVSPIWIATTVRQRWNEPADRHPPPREIEIAVAYGGRHGPDLANVAKQTGLSVDDVIRLHTGASYTVGTIGFSPGFGYLIGLPIELSTPRLATPRIRVPAGSVAIGGAQTAVYPVETAGGWNLIGRTAVRLFDPGRSSPFLLQSGDNVRFRAVENLQAGTNIRPVRTSPQTGEIEVQASGLLTTVQDLGRTGYGAFGISPSGAADRGALKLGNQLVGNEAGTAGLEITLSGPRLRFRQGVTFAITGGGPNPRLSGHPVERNRAVPGFLGDTLDFDPIEPTAGARAYFAVAGGIDVPFVMGSRSADLVAGIGGIDGRALQAGDVIAIGSRTGSPRFAAPTIRERDRNRLRVHPGPQREMFDDRVWHRLLQQPYTVTNDANRVGIRLQGPPLRPRIDTDIISEGVVTGSIQIPGSGQPIILLPGRATIGGYPKIATVIDDDLDLLGQLRTGDMVRFVETAITSRYKID